MYDTADVRTYGVDGSVGAEPSRVDPQVSGALFDHVSYDVDLHLQKQKNRPCDCMLLEPNGGYKILPFLPFFSPELVQR